MLADIHGIVFPDHETHTQYPRQRAPFACRSAGNHDMATDRSLEMAQRLMMQGRMAEAERIYRELLGTEPENLSVLEGLGVVLYQQNRGEDAAAVFARGVAIEPESVRFQANLGEALRTIGKFDQALAHLEQAVAIAPTNVPAWNSLGLVAFALRRYDVAEHAFRTAIRHDPRYVRPQVNLADTLLASGTADRGARRIARGPANRARQPDGTDQSGGSAHRHARPDDLAEAETLSRRAVALSPRSAQTLATLARVLRLQGRTEVALEYEGRAGRLEPGSAAGRSGSSRRNDDSGEFPGSRPVRPGSGTTRPTAGQTKQRRA